MAFGVQIDMALGLAIIGDHQIPIRVSQSGGSLVLLEGSTELKIPTLGTIFKLFPLLCKTDLRPDSLCVEAENQLMVSRGTTLPLVIRAVVLELLGVERIMFPFNDLTKRLPLITRQPLQRLAALSYSQALSFLKAAGNSPGQGGWHRLVFPAATKASLEEIVQQQSQALAQWVKQSLEVDGQSHLPTEAVKTLSPASSSTDKLSDSLVDPAVSSGDFLATPSSSKVATHSAVNLGANSGVTFAPNQANPSIKRDRHQFKAKRRGSTSGKSWETPTASFRLFPKSGFTGDTNHNSTLPMDEIQHEPLSTSSDHPQLPSNWDTKPISHSSSQATASSPQIQGAEKAKTVIPLTAPAYFRQYPGEATVAQTPSMVSVTDRIPQALPSARTTAPNPGSDFAAIQTGGGPSTASSSTSSKLDGFGGTSPKTHQTEAPLSERLKTSHEDVLPKLTAQSSSLLEAHSFTPVGPSITNPSAADTHYQRPPEIPCEFPLSPLSNHSHEDADIRERLALWLSEEADRRGILP